MTRLHRDNSALYAMPNGVHPYAEWLRDDITAAPTPSNARFNVWSAADALEPQPEIEWIVERLFSAGSVSMVFGDGGSKKTYSMLDLLVCVATGAKWLGLSVKKCPVLFMDEEAGKIKILRRVSMCQRGHGVEGTPLDFHGSSLGQLNICASEDIYELRNLIQQYGARLIIIDSWIASAHAIENENDAVKVQAVYRLLRPLADELQVAIVMIDHTNKNLGYRGSTAKKGGVDCMLGVTSANGSSNIAFHVEKARDTEPFKFGALANFSDGEYFYLSERTGQNSSGVSGSRWDSIVLNYLIEKGPETVKNIVAACDGLKEAGTRKVIGRLTKENKIRRADDGGKGKRASYEAI